MKIMKVGKTQEGGGGGGIGFSKTFLSYEK